MALTVLKALLDCRAVLKRLVPFFSVARICLDDEQINFTADLINVYPVPLSPDTGVGDVDRALDLGGGGNRPPENASAAAVELPQCAHGPLPVLLAPEEFRGDFLSIKRQARPVDSLNPGKSGCAV